MRPPARPRVQPPAPEPKPAGARKPAAPGAKPPPKETATAGHAAGDRAAGVRAGRSRPGEGDRPPQTAPKPPAKKPARGEVGSGTAVGSSSADSSMSARSVPTAVSARTGAIPLLRPIRSKRGEAASTGEVSSGLTARLAEREGAAKRRRMWRFVVLGGLLVLILALAWLLLLSPVFRLVAGEVRITGEGTVIKPGQVEEVVASDVGTPLTVLDTVGLRRRVLDVPGVRDAKITRDWPRGLTVVLASREPVAAVPDAGDYALLDDEGIQVGRSSKPPKGLPTISVPLSGDNRRTLEATLFMLNAVPAEVHKEIKSVSAKSPDAVSMKLRDGATVLWGSTADADLKVRVLEVLRAAKQTKKAKVFDVSAPNAPITR